MQEELTEYEKQKAQKKRELVRNELQTVGKYQIPLIKKQEIDFDTISLLSNGEKPLLFSAKTLSHNGRLAKNLWYNRIKNTTRVFEFQKQRRFYGRRRSNKRRNVCKDHSWQTR